MLFKTTKIIEFVVTKKSKEKHERADTSAFGPRFGTRKAPFDFS